MLLIKRNPLLADNALLLHCKERSDARPHIP